MFSFKSQIERISHKYDMNESEKVDLVWDSIIPSLKRELKMRPPGKIYLFIMLALSLLCKKKWVYGTMPFINFYSINK